MKDISHELSFLSGAWHLSYYIPEFKPYGSLSYNILQFKNFKESIVKSWTNWSKDELSKLGIHFDYIIRALGSNELSVSYNKGLDYLGIFLEQKLPSLYIPEILKKNYLTPPMHTLSRTDRGNEIHNSYIVTDQTKDFNNKNILILDDVITTGTTIREIHRALNEVWQNGNYHLFCLSKTLRGDMHANDDISMKYFI